MLDELDNALIEIISENNKLPLREIHKKIGSRLEREVRRAIVLSRLMGLVESGHLDLVEIDAVGSVATTYVYRIKTTE